MIKANASDTEAPFDFNIYVFLMALFHQKYDKPARFNCDIVNFPFRDGPSNGVYILQIITFSRMCSHVTDFNAQNEKIQPNFYSSAVDIRFGSDKGMIINIVKTMIVVFKKTGRLVRNETWSLGGEHKQVIPCFSYVGANFTRQLSLTQITKEQLVKETRILISILSKVIEKQ